MQDLELAAWADELLSGLWVTVYVTLLSSVGALILSFVLGLLARMRKWAPRTAARVVIEFFRGTSLLVQLFWIYLVLPQLGIQFDPLAVAVIAFSLNFGAYGAEVVRGAINAVPKPQWEGCIALSLSPYLRMRRVILPQALPLMLPPFNNLLIQLLKSTPLVFLITLQDLTYVGDAYRLSLGNEAFIFPLLLLIYFLLSYLFTLLMRVLEVRAKERLGQPRDRRGFFAVRRAEEEEVAPL